VWNGRSFGSSTSFAKRSAKAEIVYYPKFRMPLRSTQTIFNDQLPGD
jgi:hypothetical protein